ncbi:MAG: DUF5615 family PIN-like protein [Opitutaceae bacterium]
MKDWLLDQNLPARLGFTPTLPVVSAASLGRNPTDSQLWDHAREHELAIITKDADFSGRIILQTPPPWVVHLRFGNLRLGKFRMAANRSAAASAQAGERLRRSRRSHRVAGAERLVMADVFSKRKRSAVMSAIRSHGNRDTELRLIAISGPAASPAGGATRSSRAKPDFVFPVRKLAIFVDGCFRRRRTSLARLPDSRHESQSQRRVLARQAHRQQGSRPRRQPPPHERLEGAADLGA